MAEQPAAQSAASLSFPSVTLVSRDPRRLAGFYEDVLGLSVESTSGDRVELAAGETSRLILERGEMPLNPYAAGLFHIAFRYPRREDLGAALGRIRATEAHLEGASDHDVSEALYLSDPEGNGIELTWDRPRSVWRYRDGSLLMGTHRLDLESLMRAGGAEAVPQSAPAGLDIGHVHFRVADLEAAERFWVEEVGLEVTVKYGQVATFLSVGGYHHHIGINRFAPWTPAGGTPFGVRRITMAPSPPPEEASHLVTPDGVETVFSG